MLVATEAQETRDMIRILANLFQSRGDKTPILTAADFRLDDDAAGIGALLELSYRISIIAHFGRLFVILIR